MLELLEKALQSARYWTELRYHNRNTVSVMVENGKVRSAMANHCSGVGVRVLAQGAWGFSSASSSNIESIKNSIIEATQIAEFMDAASNKKLTIAPFCATAGEYSVLTTDPLTDHSIEEKIALAVKTEEIIRTQSREIISAKSIYSDFVDEKYIVNSEGLRVHFFDAKPDLILKAIASRKGELATAAKSIGITGGWQELISKDNLEEMAACSARLAVDNLSAPYPDGGKFTVIMAPEVVGLLAHEAIGHTVEADFVLSGSAAQGKMGEQVASELITLCDSGISEIAPYAGGSIPVDDEGIPAGKTVIIENGILKSFLHNRETAAEFGVEPTGNARAWIFESEPIIRMRNTYIEPGDSDIDEMISEIKDGYYLMGGGGGGQADANAEFMFKTPEAYRIKNGRKAELVREVIVSGQAFEVMKSVDAVSSEFKWAMGAGYCGKLQQARVDGGGPSIRCKAVIGGK